MWEVCQIKATSTYLKNGASKSIVHVIKHVNFQLHRAYFDGGIWKKQTIGNKYINKYWLFIHQTMSLSGVEKKNIKTCWGSHLCNMTFNYFLKICSWKHYDESEKNHVLVRNFNSTWKNRIFQHQHQRKIKLYIYLHLFHGWFPLELVFIYSFLDVVRNEL